MIQNTRKDGSVELGMNAELRFENILRANDFQYRKANRIEDMYEHWDYQVAVPFSDRSERFEVKSMKRLNRHDNKTVSDIVYIEFFNVNGKLGWIHGQADYIAFEQPDHFLCVNRKDLENLASELVQNNWAPKPTLYKLYRRKDRPKEMVSLITVDDMVKNCGYFKLG